MRKVLSISIIAMLACGDKDEELQYYATCGDPACEGYNGPVDGLATCSTETEGASCTEAGAECDLENSCNQRLICASEDPSTECPVSEAKHKRDINYIDGTRAHQIQKTLEHLKIAEWNYKSDTKEREPRLGFIIDDNPNVPAVHENGKQVDLYGYTSMAVVTIQQQARQIELLEARITKLEEALQNKESATQSK